ncbi:MAG: hypothetical protein K5978_06020 [Campylobacter sp.]|nr:hypothetical protein [Campylobacter sp.]
MIDSFDVAKLLKSEIYQATLKRCLKKADIKFVSSEITSAICLPVTHELNLAGITILNLITAIDTKKFVKFFASYTQFLRDIAYVDEDKIYHDDMLIRAGIYHYFLENDLDKELKHFVKKLKLDKEFYENLKLL